ncbi:hypothetical protein [Salibacterium aidingense]|uniref:hypothetical protein n=1 Tax=Salibacterium aidingense TaxID=384933 RepID=UPI003BDD5648
MEPALAEGETSEVTVTATDQQDNLVSGLEIKYDVSITNEGPTDEEYQIDGDSYDQNSDDHLIGETEEDGTITFDIALPDPVDNGDGFELTIRGNVLDDRTIQEETITYSKN